MAGATETVAFDIKVTGEQASAAKVDRVSGAFKKLETGAGGSGKALQQAGERIAKISALASTASPELGKLTGTLGKAAGAASTLSLAIGGPAGLAVGGLVAAFSIWTDHTEKQRAKLEELNKEMRDAMTVALTFEERLNAVTKASAQRDMQQRLGSGAASSDEYKAKIMQLREQLRREQASNPGAVTDFERGYQRDINDYQSRLANARAREDIDKQASAAETYGQIGDAPKTGAGSKSDQSAARNQLEAVRAAGDARKELHDQHMQALEDVRREYEMREREGTKLMLDEKKQAIDAEYQASRDAAAERIRIRQDEAAEYERLEAEAAERGQMRRDIAISGAQNVAGATTKAMVAVARGQKMTVGMYLAAIGEQAVADGSFRILKGAGMLAESYGIDPAGYATIAAGSAEVAFGLALGAAGGGGKRGASAGGGGGRAMATARPSEPTSMRGNDGPRETRSNIQVNVQTLVADERVGERVMGAIEQANQKLGRTFSGQLVRGR
jgi:hypothetical protein